MIYCQIFPTPLIFRPNRNLFWRLGQLGLAKVWGSQLLCTSMKVGPCPSILDILQWHFCLQQSDESILTPHMLPSPPCTSIQSQEAASVWPEGRKGAVSDHIITQREAHSASLLYGGHHQCWVSFSESERRFLAIRTDFVAENPWAEDYDIWASLFGIYQDTWQNLWSQSFTVGMCVWKTGSCTLPHFFSSPARPPASGL